MAELLTHCQEHLHVSKWPFVICYMDDIPKGKTNKAQRIRLAHTPTYTRTQVHPGIYKSTHEGRCMQSKHVWLPTRFAQRCKMNEFTDAMPVSERTFEAECPGNGVDLKVPIACRLAK